MLDGRFMTMVFGPDRDKIKRLERQTTRQKPSSGDGAKTGARAAEGSGRQVRATGGAAEHGEHTEPSRAPLGAVNREENEFSTGSESEQEGTT